MGWAFGWDRRKELINDLTEDRGTKTVCIKKCYRGGFRTGVLWSVWEYTEPVTWGDRVIPIGYRYIRCDLLRYYRNQGWGYKDMTESMGPYYYSCPKSYLAMTPVENAEWREKVLQYHQDRLDKRQKVC